MTVSTIFSLTALNQLYCKLWIKHLTTTFITEGLEKSGGTMPLNFQKWRDMVPSLHLSTPIEVTTSKIH